MSRREEIEQLSQTAYESEDLPTLEHTHVELERLIQSMRQNLPSTTDADVVNLLNELIEQAQSVDHDLKQKIAQIKVDMMDPTYAARKAARDREKADAAAKAEEMARKLQEGIGGFLGGLGSAFGFGGAGASSGPAAAPAAAKCGQCGAALAPNAKFCPECGTPIAKEKRCSGCNAKLEPGTKFCPDCGTKA
jgi:RNA polymerase subunit RPABC4/transcription elongation factor Spt4